MCHFFSCFFFKQKTAYEMRISDWSSDVCSSDLIGNARSLPAFAMREDMTGSVVPVEHCAAGPDHLFPAAEDFSSPRDQRQAGDHDCKCQACDGHTGDGWPADLELRDVGVDQRSEESRVGEGCVSKCRSRGGPA